MAISQNYTRLATLCAVFNQNPPGDNDGKAKIVSTNYSPTAQSEDMSYHLAMGSRRVPDNDVRGTPEAWYKLKGALGLYNSLAHSSSVDRATYKSDSFALGIDVERLPMISSSGENLSTGQTIFLNIKGMGTAAADIPRQCRVCTHFEKVISIMDSVVEVFE